MPPRPAQPAGRAPARGRARRPSRTVAIRRRRVLAALLLATVVVAVATPLSPVPGWAPLVAVAMLLGFLVHLRRQARTERDVSRVRDAVRKRSRSRLMRFEAVERLRAVRRELAEERAEEERRWQEAEEAERRLREAEAAERARREAGWSPVPVPLPTYVSKPVAPRRAPAIDLTDPGSWSTTEAAQAQPPPQARSTAPPAQSGVPAQGVMSRLLDDADDADLQLDAIIERRAVND
jgi:ABC-type multidrug transport system fused ATPase/permease subunit